MNNLIKYFKLDSLDCWHYFCILLGDYDLELGCDRGYMRANNLRDNFELIKHLRDSHQIEAIRSRFNEKKLKIVDDLVGMFNITDTQYALHFSSDKDLFDDMDRFLLSVGDLSTSWLKCEVEDTNEETVYSICMHNGILEGVYNRLMSSQNIVEYARFKKPRAGNVFKTTEYPKNGPNTNNAILDYIKQGNQQNPNDLKLFMCSMAVWFEWLNTNKYEQSVQEPGYLFVDAFFYNFVILKLKNALQKSAPKKDTISRILCQHLDADKKPYQDIVNLYLGIGNKGKGSQHFQTDLKYVHRVNEFQVLYFTMGAYAKLEKLPLKWLFPDDFLNCFFVCKFVQEVGEKGTELCKLNGLLKVSFR